MNVLRKGHGKKFLWTLLSAEIFLGTSVPLRADAPRRVVSLIPSHTEILSVLKAEDALVGVSDAEREQDYARLPRVGGLEPNWEMLMALKPDLILADVAHERFRRDFDRFQLPVLFLPSTRVETLEDVFGLVRHVGELMERAEFAEELIRGYRTRLETLEARIPSAGSPRVYFEIWPRPLQACGPNSLQGHLISRAKAKNIVPRSRNAMPLISLEWVSKQSPDVILHTGVVADEEIARRPAWNRLPAVLSRRVYRVDRDKFSRAGPTILDAYEELIHLLYGTSPP